MRAVSLTLLVHSARELSARVPGRSYVAMVRDDAGTCWSVPLGLVVSLLRESSNSANW